MNLLLTPYVQKDLGVVILKPARESLKLFINSKVLVSTAPQKTIHAEQEQLDPRLIPFLTSLDVINAAGGAYHFTPWLKRNKKHCQMSNDKCHKELTYFKYNGVEAACLCWHHDNEYRDHPPAELKQIVINNLVEWVLSVIKRDLSLQPNRHITNIDVCWWATIKNVFTKLPEDYLRDLLQLPKQEISGVQKESSINAYDDSATSKINRVANITKDHIQTLSKPIKRVVIDPEPPASFMLRPKLKTWTNDKYCQWVKTQPCVCCGNQADDPHHIISAGLGGKMGGKTHDLFIIPLCRIHHSELHKDVIAWEQKYGSQLEHVINLLNYALSIEAIV